MGFAGFSTHAVEKCLESVRQQAQGGGTGAVPRGLGAATWRLKRRRPGPRCGAACGTCPLPGLQGRRPARPAIRCVGASSRRPLRGKAGAACACPCRRPGIARCPATTRPGPPAQVRQPSVVPCLPLLTGAPGKAACRADRLFPRLSCRQARRIKHLGIPPAACPQSCPQLWRMIGEKWLESAACAISFRRRMRRMSHRRRRRNRLTRLVQRDGGFLGLDKRACPHAGIDGTRPCEGQSHAPKRGRHTFVNP